MKEERAHFDQKKRGGVNCTELCCLIETIRIIPSLLSSESHASSVNMTLNSIFFDKALNRMFISHFVFQHLKCVQVLQLLRHIMKERVFL